MKRRITRHGVVGRPRDQTDRVEAGLTRQLVPDVTPYVITGLCVESIMGERKASVPGTTFATAVSHSNIPVSAFAGTDVLAKAWTAHPMTGAINLHDGNVA